MARYRSGQEYVTAYAKARFHEVCRSLTPQQPDPSGTEKNRRDHRIARRKRLALNDVQGFTFQWGGRFRLPTDFFSARSAPIHEIPEAVPAIETSAGQAEYRCESAQGARIAYAYARTSFHRYYWFAGTLASYVAPADQVGLARSVLLHATQSFQINDQWKQYQARMDDEALVYQRQRQAGRMRELSRQVAEFEVRMQAMRNQVNAFEQQQARQAEQVTNFGNILTGLTSTTDPLGNPHQVWTGPKNRYWIDGQGRTVNSDLPPGPGCSR